MTRGLGTQLIDFEAGCHVLESGLAHGGRTESCIWVFPGLGCRHVGMGYDIIGRAPAADRIIAQAQPRLDFDLAELCLEGSGRKYVPARQEAQAIYVIECAYAAVLDETGFSPCAVSGHSLGSLAAASVCGSCDFLTGLELTTYIETLLEEYADGRGQAMGVIVGLSEGLVSRLLDAESGACLANWNSPGQYVIGGDGGAVDRVLAAALEQGARQSKRLPGERAMHTPWMNEVVARLRERLAAVPIAAPRVPFVSSGDARILRTAADLREELGGFLARPVRWESAARALREGWGTTFLEVGPGNLLCKMLPFIDRTASIRTASEVLEEKK